MKKKRIIAMLLTLAVLVGLSAFLPGAVIANTPVTVIVNGKTVAFPDVQPFIDSNGRILVPVRFVSEELGCEVDWNASTRRVTIDRGRINVVLTIGQREITVMRVVKTMDTAAQVQNGRTLVPARFVAEAFGCEVAWNAATRTVTITDPGKDIYKIGSFTIDIEEGDRLSPNSSGGLIIDKESGLMLSEGINRGKPVLQIGIALFDNNKNDIPKQRQETEILLKQSLNERLTGEIMSHVANVRTIFDTIDTRIWDEGRYSVIAAGGRGVITIMVYMD